MSQTTPTPAEVLRQAATAYCQSQATYRDGLLKTGGFLHAYCLAVLSQGIDKTERDRRHNHWTRKDAVRAASVELGCSRDRINELIHCAMVAEIFGVDGLGKVGWYTLNLFARFLRRKTHRQPEGSRIPGRGGVPVTDTEEWEVDPNYEGTALALFRRCVSENLLHGQVKILVAELSTGLFSPKLKRRRKLTPAEQTAFDTLAKAVKVCSVGDTTGTIMRLVAVSPDPYVLAQKLIHELSGIKKQRRATFGEVG